LYDGILLRCLSQKEAQEVLKEAHDGMCGAHQPGLKFGDQLIRLGYFWPKMILDAIAYTKRCHACQVHDDFIHQAPGYLHSTISRGRSISPPSSKGHRFILGITGYFSKWAKAIPLREVKVCNVVKFIKHHVIYRIGVP